MTGIHPPDATFGFAAPNTPIEQVLKAIEFVIKQTAVANDLTANVFEIDPKAESGAAKFAESIDLLEARQDDIDLWRKYEAQLFEVIKVVVNTHAPGTIRAAGQATEVVSDAFGRQIMAYGGIPIGVIGDDATGNAILDFDDGSGNDDTTSIYAVRFGLDALHGIQTEPMSVRDLGELDSKRKQIGAIVTETVYDGRAPLRALPDFVAAMLRPYFAAAESANSVAMVL